MPATIEHGREPRSCGVPWERARRAAASIVPSPRRDPRRRPARASSVLLQAIPSPSTPRLSIAAPSPPRSSSGRAASARPFTCVRSASKADSSAGSSDGGRTASPRRPPEGKAEGAPSRRLASRPTWRSGRGTHDGEREAEPLVRAPQLRPVRDLRRARHEREHGQHGDPGGSDAPDDVPARELRMRPDRLGQSAQRLLVARHGRATPAPARLVADEEREVGLRGGQRRGKPRASARFAALADRRADARRPPITSSRRTSRSEGRQGAGLDDDEAGVRRGRPRQRERPGREVLRASRRRAKRERLAAALGVREGVGESRQERPSEASCGIGTSRRLRPSALDVGADAARRPSRSSTRLPRASSRSWSSEATRRPGRRAGRRCRRAPREGDRGGRALWSVSSGPPKSPGCCPATTASVPGVAERLRVLARPGRSRVLPGARRRGGDLAPAAAAPAARRPPTPRASAGAARRNAQRQRRLPACSAAAERVAVGVERRGARRGRSRAPSDAPRRGRARRVPAPRRPVQVAQRLADGPEARAPRAARRSPRRRRGARARRTSASGVVRARVVHDPTRFRTAGRRARRRRCAAARGRATPGTCARSSPRASRARAAAFRKSSRKRPRARARARRRAGCGGRPRRRRSSRTR